MIPLLVQNFDAVGLGLAGGLLADIVRFTWCAGVLRFLENFMRPPPPRVASQPACRLVWDGSGSGSGEQLKDTGLGTTAEPGCYCGGPGGRPGMRPVCLRCISFGLADQRRALRLRGVG